MIDIRRLRSDPDGSRTSLARRGDPGVLAQLDRILELDRRRRELLTRTEALKAERNAASDEVARRKKNREPADDLLAELKASGDRVKALDAEVRAVDAELDAAVLLVPNFPHEQVPDGDATANRVVRTWGEPSAFDFSPKPHWDIAAGLGILDLAVGAKVTGSGFPLFRGMGARLGRALA